MAAAQLITSNANKKMVSLRRFGFLTLAGAGVTGLAAGLTVLVAMGSMLK